MKMNQAKEMFQKKKKIKIKSQKFVNKKIH